VDAHGSFIHSSLIGVSVPSAGRFRLSDAGSWEYSALYYRCNRILVEMLDAGGPLVRPLALPRRHIVFREISRHVAPRPQDVADDRRRLQKLPVFLYNSAPEPDVIGELKDKVRHGISYRNISSTHLGNTALSTARFCRQLMLVFDAVVDGVVRVAEWLACWTQAQ